MKRFTSSYEHEGSQYVFELRADSFEDAHARLQAIRMSGRVDGVIAMTIPASVPGAGLFVRLLCWFKNLRRPA